MSSYLLDGLNEIVIEINDEGTGISKDVLPRIFDPFFTTRRSDGGTGIGLAVCANIVNMHGGRIEVQSKEDVGTLFKILLPVERMKKHFKILVAEDDESIRELIVKGLRLNPEYLIIEACNGIEACIQLGQEKPDLLVMDIRMPDMNGVETCRFIKNRQELAGINVLITTGYPQSPDAGEIVDMGFKNILPKPFNILDLVGMVEMILKKTKMRLK